MAQPFPECPDSSWVATSRGAFLLIRELLTFAAGPVLSAVEIRWYSSECRCWTEIVFSSFADVLLSDKY